MGQSQTREELRAAVQDELGAYFISALPADSASQDAEKTSSCTALIEHAQLEKWLSSPARPSASTAGSPSDSAPNSLLDDLAHLWTQVNPEDTSKKPEESSGPNTASPEVGHNSSGAESSEKASKLHGLMVGTVQLDMTRPVIVHAIKKSSPSSFTFHPPAPPASSNVQDPSPGRSPQSWTPGETPRSAAHSRQQSATSQQPLEDRPITDTNDVAVTDYLSELEIEHGKVPNKDDKCRFFSISRPQKSDASNASLTDQVNESSVVNQWFEKSHVAILSASEIAALNESHSKAKQLRPSVDSSGYSSEIKSPRSMLDESEVQERQQDITMLIPPVAPTPALTATTSQGKKVLVTQLRGVVSLEKSTVNEVRALAQPHPNMVLPLKIVEGPDHIFLLFPYHRYSLETIFRFSPGVMDNEAKKMFVAYQLLRTLQWLHDSGMVHGDIRPHNLKLTARLWLMLSGTLFAPGGLKSEMTELVPSESSLRGDSVKVAEKVHPSHSRVNSSSSTYMKGQMGQEEVAKIGMNQPIPLTIERTTSVADWVEGRISNFEYLMKLNEWAGRRTGDPNFHPVMPWVIDFSTPTSWRDLTKTKFRLNKGDEQLDFTYANPIPMSMTQGGKARGESPGSRTSYGPRAELTSAPYHINDTLTELTYYNYFARRTPLCLLRKYVRSNFVAAEYPSSMERLYQWSPDECIPEFYADPSIFESLNPELPDLAVPSWAGDVSKFLSLHREALESDQVSRFLHHWIDITFGHKLSGEAGKQAKNVALMDRNSHRNFGFVQLFVIPHPPRRRTTPNSASSTSTKPTVSWTIPAREQGAVPQPTESIPPIPQVSNPPPTLIGSASGITSSFTSLVASGTELYANQASGKDRRKSTRPSSIYSTSPGPQNAPPISSSPGPSPFSLLPKITINKPLPAQIISDKSNSTGTASPSSQSTPTATNISYASNSSDSQEVSLSGQHSGDVEASLLKPSLQRHASLDSNPIPNHSDRSIGEHSPRVLQRSSSDISAGDLLHSHPPGSVEHATPKKSRSELDLSTPALQASINPLAANTTGEEPNQLGGMSGSSPTIQARVAESDLTLSLHRDHYGSGSSFSDDVEGSSNAMFRFSGEHVMHTPNVSSPSNSPLADDLETYQAQASYQQSQLTTGATQSVSTPSSSTNQLLEPSQYTTPKGKLLSHSTGVSMVASPTSESPTRTSIPARTSLGPIPTTAAPPPIPSSHQSASAMATTSVATTTAASQSSSHQNSSYRSHHSSSGSPKDRSEKEKEKTSFRREFMKIFGSISDVVSSDKKSGEKSGERRDKDQSHHTSSSASPYGSHASITTSPGGALPPPVSYSDSHGKQDARKGHHAASKTGLQGTNNDPSSPSNSFNMLSASSNTIPHSTASYSSGAGIVSGQADIGLHDSTNLEDPANSLRLMGSIPSDIDSPLLSTTSSASVPQIARAHGPPTKMVTTYVEDLSSGEYQSRFLMQASLLEPIFTAPFADFELLAQNQDDERDQFEEFEQFKQLKQVRFDRAKCADLFSAGCIIYQLLSGTPLFHKDNIIQYLQGDGTWWWGSASQSIPRRFKALVFELVLAGRPYFLYALQTGVSLGYISRAMSGSQSTEQDSMETEDNPFDFGVASTLAPSIMTPTAFSGSLPNAQPQSINITDLGRLSEGVLAKFLNDDLISAPTSMKVFPSYFESVYQFLARYHGTQSRKKRVKLALENIGFLVNLPMSGLELILPDLISFFDHPDTAIDALSLIEPLAIKLGRNLTISKLLGPILSLYERIQQYQQQTTQSANASSKGTNTGPHIENFAASRLLELALELLAPRFVHTLLAKLGQNCFLKNIVSFLVNEIRSSRKEIGFAAGSAILRLVSVLSPPIYIRYILYPLLGQLNKANPEVLNAVLVEIGARMGEDVIVRHHMEVIVPLLQIHIFNKDSISVRTSTSLLKLIASLVELIHPTKIVSSLMVDHRCLFAILLTPPMHDKGLWEALLDCLSAVFSSMGLHLAIKYARPYVQQFFTLFGMPSSSALPLPSSGSNHSSFTSTSGNGESTTATSTTTITMASSQTSTNQEFDPKTLYPIMVMARFKDLLDVRSGGGNVSIQHTLGAAMRIESYLMGPVAAAPVPPTIVHGPEEGDSSVSAGLPANTTLLANASATGNGGSNSGTHAPLARHAPLEKSPSQVSIGELGTIESISKNLQVPGDNSSEVAVGSTLIAPRRLSSPVRPTSPTLSALATPPVVAETPKEKEAPPTPVLRLATANEDGHVADHMPMWLASMYGMPYIPAAATGSDSRGTSSSSSSRPTSTILAPGVVALGGTGSSGSGLANPGGGALGAQPTMGIATEKTATGPKKAMALLGATGTSSTSLNAGASPWDVSRDYEPSSAPIALHSFGPAMGHGSSNSNANSSNPNAGGGWPPSLGPNQTWNFSGQVGHSFKEHSNAIRCVHVHDNERLFLTGSKDTTVKCWDMLSEGASRQTYTGHRFAVTHAEFVDRGNLVASCDGSVHVWELERGNKLANMEAASVSAYASNSSRDRESPSAVFTCFTSHQDGRVVVCGTSLSTVTFTDLRAEQEVVCEWYLPTNAATSSSSVSQGPASGPGGSSGTTTGASPSTYPRSISLGHLDQNLMVVGQSSGHVTLIDIRSGILLHNWRAHDAPIISLKSVPDAPGFLVSASLDKTIALWDISNANTASPSILTHFKGHSDPLISFDIFKGTLYSISGQKIAIAPLFGQPSLVTLEKRKLIKTTALKLTNQLTSFNVLQSHHLALVGADDGTIKVLQ